MDRKELCRLAAGALHSRRISHSVEAGGAAA